MSQYYPTSLLEQFAPTDINALRGGSLNVGPSGIGGLGPLQPLPINTGLAAQAEGTLGNSLAARAAGLIPRAAVTNPEAAGLMRFAAPGASKLATAGRLGGYGALGAIGSWGIDKFDIGGNQSNWEQALQGAAQGGGIGAGIGSIVPGIGTGVGAAVGSVAGGAIGVLTNMFGGGGEDKPDPVTVLATAISQAGLTPDYTEAVLQTYETQMALAEGLEGDAKTAAQQQAFEQTSALILQAMQQQQQTEAQAPAAAANTLALQQQAQQIFQPLSDDIRTSSNLYAQAMSGIRDSLPESYRAVSDATVARELTSADRLANAYQAQAALTPVVQQLTRYQQDQDAFAQQMFSQQLAQQAAAMNQGGFASPGAINSNFLAQLTPQ